MCIEKRNWSQKKLIDKGEVIVEADVWLGNKPRVNLISSKKIISTLSFDQIQLLKSSIEYSRPIEAPIKKNDVLGKLKIIIDGNMLIGAMLAGKAFANSPVAAVHALAYPIGGTFHVSHGLSNSLVLPYVLRFNSVDTKASKDYSELAPYVFPDLDINKGTQAKTIMQSIKNYENKFGTLGDDNELVDENDLLSKLIETSISKDKPIIVSNKNKEKVGVISQSDLLKAVVEGNENE